VDRLTPLAVKHAKAGRHADGKGLYLLVKPTGARSWMLRVQVDGRRRDIGLGSADDVSLKDARDAARETRKLAKAGVDPIAERKKVKGSNVTFETAARACHKSLKAGWKNQKHSDSWLSSLENYAFPSIGSKAVASIDAAAVRDVLEPIWLTKSETARRTLQRIGAVLDFAHIKGWRPTEATLRSVRKGLPKQADTDEHMAAMPWSECPAYFQRVSQAEQTIGRDALRFTMLTALRSSEVRGARPAEFDLAKAKWTVPAERMKMKKVHEVHLPPAAIAIVQPLIDACESKLSFIFSADGETAISDATMLKVMRDDEIADYTVHGFRSSFTDWAAENTEYPKEIRDACLAHKIPDKVEAAYRRTDFYGKRARLMNEWASFLSDRCSNEG
jgi:integrase